MPILPRGARADAREPVIGRGPPVPAAEAEAEMEDGEEEAIAGLGAELAPASRSAAEAVIPPKLFRSQKLAAPSPSASVHGRADKRARAAEAVADNCTALTAAAGLRPCTQI